MERITSQLSVDLKNLDIEDTSMTTIETDALIIEDMTIKSIGVDGLVMWPFYLFAATTIMSQIKFLLRKQTWVWSKSRVASSDAENLV